MDDRGVAPALCLFSAVLRLSLPKGEGRVRVSLRWDAAPANSSPQSSPLYERREANQPGPSVFQPLSVLR
jgi:hypothetical protein